MKYLLSLLLLPLLFSQSLAQQGSIRGRVYDASNNEPVPFANIIIFGTTSGSTSDINGNYSFSGLEPGFTQLAASAVGFETRVTEDFMVTNSKTAFINIALKEKQVQLQEVVVTASPFTRVDESPVSLHTIQISEIEKNPGGNRDISKVIQILPGVASTPAFRNDVIVRGGGASENSFYLDGIEIPNLNHFSTQGASGGPVGIINVDFIREVRLYTGAFPADIGKSLSSVLDMKLIDGNKEKLVFKGSVGATDFALTLNGPLSKKSTFLFSVRRSYLKFLFNTLGLPFLPTYNDYLAKYKINFDEKNELSLISLGSLDQFKLNTGLKNPDESQRYILSYLPVNKQWSYTFGAVYRHFNQNGFTTLVLSRNMLNNRSYKYRDNIETDSLKTFDYNSTEAETKIRAEHTAENSGYRINYGAGMEYSSYSNRTYKLLYESGAPNDINYNSRIDFFSWNIFGQITRGFLEERLRLSLGLRMDANNYTSYMSNLLNQISPRLSASYFLTEKFSLNFNTGRYYQRLPYTTLGFRDNSGVLVNKLNDVRYISADHLVAGVEYLAAKDAKISLEGFYKYYTHYPFSVKDSINIASKSADYGTYGDEEIRSISKGRAYGFEVYARDKSLLGFNIILSYTFVRSEFTDKNGSYVPSAWDNHHILNLTIMRDFKNHWDAGIKWRFVGGAPYTPADLILSSMRPAWDVRGREYPDYSRFNSLRLAAFHQLDLRVDKMFFFNKWSLTLYLDIQNVYNFQSENPPQYTNLSPSGVPDIVNPEAPYDQQEYKLRSIPSESGTILPSVGIIVEL